MNPDLQPRDDILHQLAQLLHVPHLLDLELVDVVAPVLGDHREERRLARGELELLLRRAVAVPGEGMGMGWGLRVEG